MARRCHIIFAHTADRDGYKYFYLYYYPGDRVLTLKLRQNGDEEQEYALPPVAMLDWIEGRVASGELEGTQSRAWDRMGKALRVRIRRWLEESEE